jgi:predicted alpha/beta-hydrolase family hydrolase
MTQAANHSHFAFEVDGAETTATLYASPNAQAAIVLAHGAGAPQTHPWMVNIALALESRGLDVVTFDFLYAHDKRRVPDRNDVLEATWRAAVSAVRARVQGHARYLFVGGKSMGGRIATQVAAKGGLGEIKGVVLLGYPLHPPGKPNQLRAAHLPKLAVPALFVQGSRDPFGTPSELDPIVGSLPAGGKLFVVEGGDHSLAPPKRASESARQVMDRVADEIARFCSRASG